MPKLLAKNITKSYQNVPIIEDIQLTLNQNELVCLLGVSGTGKSTLFNVLSGLSKPDSGQVILDNQDITGIAGHVAYMQQKDLLLPFKTVMNNVTLPLIIRGESKKTARIKAGEYFNLFGISGTEDKYPIQLSGGMRQRAALLRTYLFSSTVALLDEPFSALDTLTKTKIHTWYLDIMNKMPISTLFITHDIDEAITLSDRIYIMSGIPGKITSEIKIDVPKPRNADFNTSDSFIFYKKTILKLL